MDFENQINNECLKFCKKTLINTSNYEKCQSTCRYRFYISIGRFPKIKKINDDYTKYEFPQYNYGNDSEEVTQEQFRQQDKFRQ